jgi:3-(3-hydroxy-phenyl)propionate hydroxylase
VLVDDDLRFDDVAGGRFAIITVTEPTPAQRQQIERRGAVIVIACAAGELHRWLRRGRTKAVLVRPDGTVGRTGRDLTVLVEALPPFGSHRALPTRLTNTVTIPHSGPHRPSGSAG